MSHSIASENNLENPLVDRSNMVKVSRAELAYTPLLRRSVFEIKVLANDRANNAANITLVPFKLVAGILANTVIIVINTLKGSWNFTGSKIITYLMGYKEEVLLKVDNKKEVVLPVESSQKEVDQPKKTVFVKKEISVKQEPNSSYMTAKNMLIGAASIAAITIAALTYMYGGQVASSVIGFASNGNNSSSNRNNPLMLGLLIEDIDGIEKGIPDLEGLEGTAFQEPKISVFDNKGPMNNGANILNKGAKLDLPKEEYSIPQASSWTSWFQRGAIASVGLYFLPSFFKEPKDLKEITEAKEQLKAHKQYLQDSKQQILPKITAEMESIIRDKERLIEENEFVLDGLQQHTENMEGVVLEQKHEINHLERELDQQKAEILNMGHKQYRAAEQILKEVMHLLNKRRGPVSDGLFWSQAWKKLSIDFVTALNTANDFTKMLSENSEEQKKLIAHYNHVYRGFEEAKKTLKAVKKLNDAEKNGIVRDTSGKEVRCSTDGQYFDMSDIGEFAQDEELKVSNIRLRLEGGFTQKQQGQLHAAKNNPEERQNLRARFEKENQAWCKQYMGRKPNVNPYY